MLSKNTVKTAVLCLALTSLVGCTCYSISVAGSNELSSLRGKLIVSTAESKNGLNFRWTEEQNHTRIDLWGTLGTHRTRILFDDSEVEIALPNGEVLTTTEAEYWMRVNLGVAVDLQTFRSWMFGTPGEPDRTSSTSYNEIGELTSFEELGWQVEVLSRENHYNQVVPKTLRISRGGLSMEVRVNKWLFNPTL